MHIVAHCNIRRKVISKENIKKHTHITHYLFNCCVIQFSQQKSKLCNK